MISEAQHALLHLLSTALFHTPLPDQSVDWSEVLLEARQQAVLPLAYSVLTPDEALRAQWGRLADRLTANSMRIAWEHAELHRLMHAQRIPYVIMKGSASAAYYPEPALREMGDVDFLVRKADLERAGAVLQANGFSPAVDREHAFHIAYHRSGTSPWEMHWEPGGLPDGEAGRRVRALLSDIIDTAVPLNDAFLAPDAFHHGLILLLHTASHMINTGIGLRHLCDWAVFVGSFSGQAFCQRFEEPLKSVGLWQFARLLTLLSETYLHAPPYAWAAGAADAALLDALMADIFAGGNFGRKDAERINQAKLMTDSARRTVDDASFARQFCRTMNERARRAMPACRRHPALLPAGWIYIGGRHVARILSGRRPKIHLGRMVEGAAARKEIYRHFHLFEI